MDGFQKDFAPATDTPSDTPKRTRTRDSLFLTAKLRLDGEAAEREVRIRNLSAGGMMAELGRTVAVGCVVWLQLRGVGEVTGRVAWCTEGRLGIALDAPIDPKQARKPVGGGAKTPVYLKTRG